MREFLESMREVVLESPCYNYLSRNSGGQKSKSALKCTLVVPQVNVAVGLASVPDLLRRFVMQVLVGSSHKLVIRDLSPLEQILEPPHELCRHIHRSQLSGGPSISPPKPTQLCKK